MAADDLRVRQGSSYMAHLPALYQEGATGGQPNFLGRYLLAFEQVLTGLGDAEEPGLAEILDGIVDPVSGQRRLGGVQRYFDPGPDLPEPERAPSEFLKWLAGWVGLSLREDMDEARQRDFIARAVSLYRLRGTKVGLERFVSLYTLSVPIIEEQHATFQIGVHSTIGVDTWLGDGPPHFFKVKVWLPTANPEESKKMREVAAAIINLEKPAHTYYELEVATPIMQVGVHSTVGVDTLLG